MKLYRQVYHWLTSVKARSAGIQIGRDVCLSGNGKFRITGNSSVVMSDGVKFASGYQIDAHRGSTISIGSDVHFGNGAIIHAHHGAIIVIEDGCSFNHDVSIFALESITIGKHSIFGPDVYIGDHNHQTVKDQLIKDQGFDTQPLSIGSDVWLGVGSTIIKGASIGDGAVVAARSVVNKPVPAYEIWGGIPAKKLGERK